MPNILNDAVYNRCRRDFVSALVLALLGPVISLYLSSTLGWVALAVALLLSILGVGELKSGGFFSPPTPRSTNPSMLFMALAVRLVEYMAATLLLAKAYPQAALLAVFAVGLEIALWMLLRAIFGLAAPKPANS
ncbi:MAG TPA: hypothetical protein VHP58_03085 [Alphaproteobacteria bacterium]|nr:hypothetical protein [Alphaproteobacteria bacterium]